MNYAQGGSGWLMSRFACEVALKHAVSMLQTAEWYDDLSLGYYMGGAGFPAIAMAGGHFIGHSTGTLSRQGLPGVTNVCSSFVEHAPRCGRYFTPVNEVVFLHAYPFRSMNWLMRLGEMVFNAPSDLYWWNTKGGVSDFCRTGDGNYSWLLASGLWASPRVKWGETSWY
jgi:hypothetical protein